MLQINIPTDTPTSTALPSPTGPSETPPSADAAIPKTTTNTAATLTKAGTKAATEIAPEANTKKGPVITITHIIEDTQKKADRSQKKRNPPSEKITANVNIIINAIAHKLYPMLTSNIVNPISDNLPLSATEKSKRSKELYVTDYPSHLSIKELEELLNTAMASMEANTEPGKSIVSMTPVKESPGFILIEFRNEKECENALKLNGMQLMDKQIKLGKPLYSDEIKQDEIREMFPTLSSFEKDLNYQNYISNTLNCNQPNNLPTFRTVSNHSNLNSPSNSKLLVTNLPIFFNESNIKDFFKIFGKLKSVELMKDEETHKFNGQCCIEFETEEGTQKALHYAMGIQIEGKVLYIKRIIPQISEVRPEINLNNYFESSNNDYTSDGKGLGILTHSVNSSLNNNLISTSQNITNYSQLANNFTDNFNEDYKKYTENIPSNVICIKNWVSLNELTSDRQYDKFYDKAYDECEIYGKVRRIKIPRPNGDYGVTGIGKVFVEFANRDGANWAKNHMNGSVLNGKVVEVVFHPEENFRKNQLD